MTMLEKYASMSMQPISMLPISDVVQDLDQERTRLGFERVSLIHGSSYKDSSTIIIIPTRGMVHHIVAGSWHGLMAPMNQKRAMLFASGFEVGHAYNELIENILKDPVLSKWKYVLTLEDDNLPPPDAHLKLLESIELGPFDAVGGLYFTKGEVNMPMAFGNPHEYAQTGEIEFRPRNVVEGISTGTVVEVNGLAMGCTLWRMDLFREIAAPWYVTVSEIIPEKGIECMTQDLYFCRRARAVGKRFAVDLRVHVGHIDVENKIVY